MLLKSLSIRALHRSLNLDVEFNEQITLLIGINGSGKTSVLNVIDWLLKPDLRRLAVAQYDSLALRFEEKGTEYELTATKNTERVMLSVEGSPTPLAPITVNLATSTEEDDEDAEERYHGLTPEKHEIPMWDLLKSFAKPTVISLDRTISAESDEVHYVEARSALVRRRNRSRSPISFVQEVTSSKYAEFRSEPLQTITN